MKLTLERGNRFVLDGLPYEDRGIAKNAGFHWSKSRKVWLCPVNRVTAYALMEEVGGDNMRELIDWMDQGQAPEIKTFHCMKTETRDYQKRAVELLVALKGYGFFFEMATGKTMTALTAANHLFDQNEVSRVLIVCPLSLFSTWKGEMTKHFTRARPFCELWGSKKKRDQEIDRFQGLHTPVLALTTYDTLWRIKDQLLVKPPCMVIADESSFIKNRKAGRTKAAIEIADHAKYKVALSGTPYVSNVTDLWSQLRFLSQQYSGSSYWRFAERYMEFDRSPWKRPVGIRSERKGELKKLIDSVSMTVRKEDVLDLPEKIYQKRVLLPGSGQTQMLKKAMEDFRFTVQAVRKGKGKGEKEETILIRNALARVNKIQQMTMGWTKNEDGSTIYFRSNPKADAFGEILQEAEGKVVVFSRYVEDLHILSSVCEKHDRYPVTYSGINAHNVNEENKIHFTEGAANVFLCQVQKGGFGIDLTAADVCVYVSNWWSTGVRRQSEDRLHRPGQKKNVLYVDLLMQGSVDEMILDAIEQNKSLSEYLFGREVEVTDE